MFADDDRQHYDGMNAVLLYSSEYADILSRL